VNFDHAGNAYIGSLGFYAGTIAPPQYDAFDNGVFLWSNSSSYTSWIRHTVYAEPNSTGGYRVDDNPSIPVDKKSTGTGAGVPKFPGHIPEFTIQD